MTNRLVFLITPLIILTYIIGCQPAKSGLTKSPELKDADSKQPVTTVSFNNRCAEILNNFVNDNGMVNYKTLKRKKSKLRYLLDEFAKLNPAEYNSWAEENKIAFWINAYNIQILQIIVDNYPIKSSRIHRILWPPSSIRHIKGIWSKYKFIVMDEEFTLAGLEQQIFHKEFDEPRLFLAISHASISSPPLQNEPYYGHKLDKQLDNQVKRFLSSPLVFRIDKVKRKIYLSAIFQPTWHGKAFISKYGTDKKFKDKQPHLRAILNFITNYIPDHDVRFLETKNYSIEYLKYDWRLNEHRK